MNQRPIVNRVGVTLNVYRVTVGQIPKVAGPRLPELNPIVPFLLSEWGLKHAMITTVVQLLMTLNTSIMNDICTPLRSRLTQDHLDSLMRISKEGCILTEDNLDKLVDLFKTDKKRQMALYQWHSLTMLTLSLNLLPRLYLVFCVFYCQCGSFVVSFRCYILF